MADDRDRPTHPRAWSSHGEARRNSGNFTRGSQLIGHQWSMWWRGARVPLFVWAALFVVFMWIKLTIVLGDYEYQMIGQRLLSMVWSYLGFSEMKAVNVTLRDGTIFRTYMGYVPFIPDVQVAWAKMTNAIIGCLILSIMGAGAFAWWYVPWAQKRGQSILADHHERGVELVEEEDLRHMLGAHNAQRLRDRAREEYPTLSLEEVSNLAYDERKRAGLLSPYRKVRTMDEAYSYGAHQTRDASTISPTTKEEALVIADDITSLPNLTGYIRFPEKFPSTLISIPYVKFDSIADGFVEADQRDRSE